MVEDCGSYWTCWHLDWAADFKKATNKGESERVCFPASRRAKRPDLQMHRLGVLALIFGATATFVGLIGGFGFMFAAVDDLAKLFLAFVPVGFLVGFVGVVMTLLGKPDA